MADAPTFDDFLADPCGVWADRAPEISTDWAVQAARSSRAYREQLKAEVCAAIQATGAFDEADRACEILAQTFDAQDIADLFRELSDLRPPTDWAGSFGKRFSR